MNATGLGQNMEIKLKNYSLFKKFLNIAKIAYGQEHTKVLVNKHNFLKISFDIISVLEISGR